MSVVGVARLRDVADLNPPLGLVPAVDEVVSFLPMAAVDAERTDAVDTQTRSFREVRKGYTPFLANDVLVAKITPCFENGKIAQAKPTHYVGFGSTEFHVLRSHASELDARYLAHFLRQKWIRKAGERRMTGSAGQRRVPEHFFANLEIPLPPLPEQRRIAAILDAADALRAKRRAAIVKLDELTQSIFLDMFGDPATNPKSLKSVPLGKVATIATGATPSRSVSGYFGGDIPWVKTTEVNGVIRDTEEKLTRSGLKAIRGKLHPIGSIVIAMYGQGKTRGHAGLLECAAAVNQACAVIHPNAVFESRFLFIQLQLGYGRLRGLGRGGNQENMNLDLVRSFPVLLPGRVQQAVFIERVDAVERIRQRGLRSLDAQEALFASLQQRAFRGEL